MIPSQAHAFARSDRTPIGMWWWTIDRWMLGVVGVLIAIGVMMSFASSPAAAARIRSLLAPLYDGRPGARRPTVSVRRDVVEVSLRAAGPAR